MSSSNSPAKAAFTGTVKVPSPKRENGCSVGPATQLIIKDVGEIHSRLLDHRPIIQGETRYFIKEFEEKRGHREMRVLENVKNSLSETSDHVLPRCTDVMRDEFGLALKSCPVSTISIYTTEVAKWWSLVLPHLVPSGQPPFLIQLSNMAGVPN
ncbi:biogenesis of lysosome-related organelles complex 1 subunit 5 isoform X2 [Bufo bufo]|uniref:biogenesis of lysosome-related organelles complex 1 subunit 5 isoform X2 n=1 Tax=Bufo bufo TaxID=8384 RepID=UPI001ABE9097|nr:biogenesis of lysosome-related organelles complex 1 subunit 5 isoform X2 [Bufo bufo]